MAFTAVFARPNHPPGYGATSDGSAHGYVLALIQCTSMLEVEAVDKVLSNGTGLKWDDRNDNWYSGPMELVAVVPSTAMPQHESHNPSAWRSIGDQRACAILRASDILTAKA